MVAQKMEDKDPAAIKLFGKKIPVPADVEDVEPEMEEEDRDHTQTEKPHNLKGWSREEANGCCRNQEGLVVVDEEKLGEISAPDHHQKTNSQDDKPAGAANSLLKKPDKILPCPRCSSIDTKFCYYNNYNMNQPRHFCRACQRYWTAGGTMRNVPVGAGRRKNKNTSSTSHYMTHITISDALQAVRIIDTTHVHHHPAFKPINGSTGAAAVLSFGAPHGKDQQLVAENGFTSPVVPGFWQYPGAGSVGGHVFYNPTAGSLPVLQAPGYWNCGTLGPVPFLSPESQKSCCEYHPTSPKLGKHSRDDQEYNSCLKQGEDLETNQESPRQKKSNVLIPKTLRIDDPDDAAKSSIWETLGIKNESLSGGGMFRGYFKSKSTDHHGKKSCVAETTSPALLANPAAFSRSISFQESS